MTPLLGGFRAIGSTAGPSGRGGAGVGLVGGTDKNEMGQGNNVRNIPKKKLGADTSPIFWEMRE